MTPEGKVVKWLRDKLKSLYPSLVYLKYPAGEFGRAGVSDLILSIKGFSVFIEVKAEGGKVTLIQQLFLDEVNSKGALGLACIGKDEKIFELIDGHINKLKA